MRGRTLWLRVASVVVVLFCLALGAGCGGSGSGNAQGKGSSGGGRLTVLAASSLTDAFKELAGRFEKQNPGTEVRTSFAASSELLAQIEQGAPADVFAPVSKKNMDTAAKKDLVGKASVFARNRPVGGLVLARVEFPGKRLVDALVDVPAVLPPSAAGIALLLAFGKMELLGEQLSLFGLQLTYTTAAVVIAELFVASHFYVRQAAVRFGRVDRDVEDAAMVDGADRVTVF